MSIIVGWGGKVGELMVVRWEKQFEPRHKTHRHKEKIKLFNYLKF